MRLDEMIDITLKGFGSESFALNGCVTYPELISHLAGVLEESKSIKTLSYSDEKNEVNKMIESLIVSASCCKSLLGFKIAGTDKKVKAIDYVEKLITIGD